MKTISFFSAKGGTGKTTFNLLLASWLKYKKGKRVTVLDLDSPEFNLFYTRKREEQYLQEQGIILPDDWFYPIYDLACSDRTGLQDALKRYAASSLDTDYMILDFGGAFGADDPVLEFVQCHHIDLVVIPLELDGMILASGKSLASVFQQLGQKTLLFFNKVHGREKPELYADLEKWLTDPGLPVSKHRIKNTVKMRWDSDNGGQLPALHGWFP